MGVRRWVRRVFETLVAMYVVLCLVGGVVLAELSLRLPRTALGDTAARRADMEAQYGGAVKEVSVVAADGATLRGWWVVPRLANGRSVAILHGITANRVDSTGYAEMLLARWRRRVRGGDRWRAGCYRSLAGAGVRRCQAAGMMTRIACALG